MNKAVSSISYPRINTPAFAERLRINTPALESQLRINTPAYYALTLPPYGVQPNGGVGYSAPPVLTTCIKINLYLKSACI